MAYGVNTFGGSLSKENIKSKLKWVNDNESNIVNYENGILLKKSKEKLLFLAFCMEYKKYIEFLKDTNSSHFYSHLPIQLDATCNGFKHLALLIQAYFFLSTLVIYCLLLYCIILYCTVIVLYCI